MYLCLILQKCNAFVLKRCTVHPCAIFLQHSATGAPPPVEHATSTATATGTATATAHTG